MSPELHRMRAQEGMALVLAIVFLAFCIIVVTGLLSYTVSDYLANNADWRRAQALYCAEAGIEKAVDTLRVAPDTTSIPERGLSADIAGADGSYEVSIAPVSGDPLGARQIVATGYVPSKANAQATRKASAVMAAAPFDFGVDCVRARLGVSYGSNNHLTVVVDSNYDVITDTSVDASVRVTGTGPYLGDISQSTGANKADVAGGAIAPGSVDISPGSASYISENTPANYIADAFPPASALGSWYASGDLIWPPAAGTWADSYYRQALVGGTLYSASGTITAPKFIELYGTGSLSNVTLRGPGIIFVHGNLGGGVVNGPPACTLVVTGNFSGNLDYTCNPGAGNTAPPLLIFGDSIEIKGSATWTLNGALIALNPSADVNINDSAITLYGAVISNGTVSFKSSKGCIGFPRSLKGKHFTAPGLPLVVSYAAR